MNFPVKTQLARFILARPKARPAVDCPGNGSRPKIFSRLTVLLIAILFSTGCVYVPANPYYTGPQPRPASIEQYYDRGTSYHSFSEKITAEKLYMRVRRFEIDTDYGPITIDYFQQNKPNDDLILVFPILGGKNFIENHFARHFALHGFDAAIVHRDRDFKKPEMFRSIEQNLRRTVIRDRIALDFFEKELSKKDFGTFGLSRGGINVVLSAGVDPRLKYNVIMMAGIDLVKIFRHSNEKGLKKYRKQVLTTQHITNEEFFKYVTETIKSEPRSVVHYIDAKNALLFLALFDRTVPIERGFQLKRQMNHPETHVVFADHYLSLLYTQIVAIFPPGSPWSILPPGYVETEALQFFNRKFRRGNLFVFIKELPFRLYKMPFNILGGIFGPIFFRHSEDSMERPIFGPRCNQIGSHTSLCGVLPAYAPPPELNRSKFEQSARFRTGRPNTN